MRSTDDPDFEAAWLAFAREEARVAAPPELERRVIARVVESAPLTVASPRSSRWLPTLAATAATMVLTTTAVLWLGRERPGVIAAQPTMDRAAHVALRAAVSVEPPHTYDRVIERGERLPRLPAVSRACSPNCRRRCCDSVRSRSAKRKRCRSSGCDCRAKRCRPWALCWSNRMPRAWSTWMCWSVRTGSREISVRS